MSADTGRPPDPTRAVDHALKLLVVLAMSEAPVPLAEAARAVQLAPSTASRLLRGLEGSRYAQRDDDGRHVVGAGFFELAAAALNGRPYLRAARPHLAILAEETGESAYLGMVDESGQQVVYVLRVPSSQEIRHWNGPGRTIPLAGTAIGAALAGAVDVGGYAVRRGAVEPDVTAVSAPVRWNGAIVAAVSVVGPTFRIADGDAERIGRLVAEHADAVTVAAGVQDG